MSSCVICSKWSLGGQDANGLCHICAKQADQDIIARLGAIHYRLGSVASEKSRAKRLEVYDDCIKHAMVVQKYEVLGDALASYWKVKDEKPESVFFIPSKLLDMLKRKRDAEVVQEAFEISEKHIEKASSLVTPNLIVANIDKAITKLAELSESLFFKKEFEPVFEKLARARIFLPLLFHFNKARKEEFKGNKKKALNHYLEAQFLLHANGSNFSIGNEGGISEELLVKKIGELKG